MLGRDAVVKTLRWNANAVGPALAGDLVAWGEEAPNGATRVVVGAPGREPLLAYRIRPATARRTERGFRHTTAAFAASATRFAAVASTATVTHAEFDHVSIAVTNAAVGGPFRGPLELLSGAIPRRGDGPCRSELQHPQAVDVDGDNIAVGDFATACIGDAPWQDRVVVSGPGIQATLQTGTGGDMRDVALAGHYVGWIHSGDRDEVVVRNLETGDTALRLTDRDLHATHIDELALQEDGTVAISYGDLNGQRLGWAAPGVPGVRLLDRKMGSRGLALAAGRVLYERGAGELMLRPLTGGPERRLARFRSGRGRVGDLDLDATRATWATRGARGPGRIVVRAL